MSICPSHFWIPSGFCITSATGLPCIRPFFNDREIVLRRKVVPGYYVVIPHTKNQNQQGDFVLRIFSEKSSDSAVASVESVVDENKALETYLSKVNRMYRVSQVSCNIKNRHISASKSSNQFLKKDLWRSRSALFVTPNFNFEYWIVAGQKNIKWVVTSSGKLSFS